MTKIEKVKCDNCGKETEERTEGWILFDYEADLTVQVFTKKDSRGYGMSTLLDNNDFCCKECMQEFFGKIVDKIMNKEKGSE